MAGRKTLAQQYGVMPFEIQGEGVWDRHHSHVSQQITVYCMSCGGEVIMPAMGEGSLDDYNWELENRIHTECAREIINGINSR